MGKNNIIFISCCSDDKDTTKIAKAFQDYIRRFREDLKIIDMSNMEESANTKDIILKLYKEIEKCDFLVHFVGTNPGEDPANTNAISEFYEKKIKRDEFIFDNRGFESNLDHVPWTQAYQLKFPNEITYPHWRAYAVKCHFDKLEKELTYTQWEACLAIHLRKKIFIYASEKALHFFGTNSSAGKINNPILRGWLRVRFFSACLFSKKLARQKKYVDALNAGRYKPIRYIDSATILGNIERQISRNNDKSLPETTFPKNTVIEKFGKLLSNNRENFIGRQWVFDEIEDWIGEEKDRRKALFITGDPGIGKSEIVAQLFNRLIDDQKQAELNNRELKNRVLACHFCRAGDDSTLLPWDFIQNVAAMIHQRFPKFTEQLGDWGKFENENSAHPTSAFIKILQILQKLPQPTSDHDHDRDQSLYILIDALDEALTEDKTFSYRNGKSIVHLLNSTLGEFPHWLRIVATTRKDNKVLDQFSQLETFFELEANHENNLKDVKQYVEHHLKLPAFKQELDRFARDANPAVSIESLEEEIINKLVGQSGGNFLLVSLIIDEILITINSASTLQAFSLSRIDQWPTELPVIFDGFFRRRFGIDARNYPPAKIILEVIFAAREPLKKTDLEKAVKQKGNAFDEPLDLLKQFLSTGENSDTYAPFHKSLTDWLLNPETKEKSVFRIHKEDGEKRLADLCVHQYQQFPKRKELPSNQYWVRHGSVHLLKTFIHICDNDFAFTPDTYRYINTAVNILGSLNSKPTTQKIVLSALPLLTLSLKKTEKDLGNCSHWNGKTIRDIALEELGKMKVMELFNIVKQSVATDVTENVIRWIGKTHKGGWQELVKKMLALNEYVIRYAASCGQAERYKRLRDDSQIDCAEAEISGLLNSSDINEIEMGGYAVGEIAKEELVTGLESVTKQWLEKISKTDIYFCQSILGDLLLNLVLEKSCAGQVEVAKKIIDELNQLNLISSFWDPIWEYTRLDVIGLLALLEIQGQQLSRTTSFRVEIDNEIAVILAREKRIDLFGKKAKPKDKSEREDLTKILRSTDCSNNDMDFIKNWILREGSQQASMAAEFLKLMFTHPLWQMCERGAAILPLLENEPQGQHICFEIVKQLMETIRSKEKDLDIAKWRVVLGTSEACYLIRHLDTTYMEDCWENFYDDQNCHVRALIVEGFFAIVGNIESKQQIELLTKDKNTKMIDCWLLDEEIWVLEHVYQAFKIIVEKQTEYDALRPWVLERFKHLRRNPDCLLARVVSNQTEQSWTMLKRGDFLSQIQAIQRSQLSQQRISH